MYLPSALFRKASAYCGQEYDKWYTLSAKYGLLSPHDSIEPYDRTLKTMSRAERKEWGPLVTSQLTALGEHVHFAHAGFAYLEPLSGLGIVNVLAGLRIGERLHCYDEHLAGVAEKASDMVTVRGSHGLESELSFERLAWASRRYRANKLFNDSYVPLLSMDSFLEKLRARPTELRGEPLLTQIIMGFLNRWDLSHGVSARRDLMAETHEILQTVHTVGPTTVSRILHILPPGLLVMWDGATREHYSALLGIFLAGLLGLMAANRIRRS